MDVRLTHWPTHPIPHICPTIPITYDTPQHITHSFTQSLLLFCFSSPFPYTSLALSIYLCLYLSFSVSEPSGAGRVRTVGATTRTRRPEKGVCVLVCVYMYVCACVYIYVSCVAWVCGYGGVGCSNSHSSTRKGVCVCDSLTHPLFPSHPHLHTQTHTPTKQAQPYTDSLLKLIYRGMLRHPAATPAHAALEHIFTQLNTKVCTHSHRHASHTLTHIFFLSIFHTHSLSLSLLSHAQTKRPDESGGASSSLAKQMQLNTCVTKLSAAVAKLQEWTAHSELQKKNKKKNTDILTYTQIYIDNMDLFSA